MKDLKENLLNTNFNYSFEEDNEGDFIDISCYVEDEDENILFFTELEYDLNEDYDDYEDLEDMEEDLPRITFNFYEENIEFYRLNNKFFEEYFEKIGAELEEDDDDYITWSIEKNMLPSAKSLLKITKQLTAAMKKAKLKTPFIEEVEDETESSVLTGEEKNYLEAVIKPYKDRIKYISKYKNDYSDKEFIEICFTNNPPVILPYFENNTMYKGMIMNKEYNLKSLGLFED